MKPRKIVDSIKQLLKALWNYRRNLKLELFFFFYIMPTFCFVVSFGNFGFEKACRVNLQYNETVCQEVLVWAELLLHCERTNTENMTAFKITTYGAYGRSCCIWRSAVKNNLIAVSITFLAVLFAGSWADRYNKRKLFMILPIIGEFLSYAGFLISAIFFDSMPMEFPFDFETYIKSFFGGFLTVIMSIFSYMTITTPQRDRLPRFGIFLMFYSIIVVLGEAISRLLFMYCGYIVSFSIALISQIIAILCVVFVVEDIDSETKKKAEPNQVGPLPPSRIGNGVDNLSCAGAEISLSESNDLTNNKVRCEVTPEILPVNKKFESSNKNMKPVRRNVCLEFFDPTLIRDFVMIPLKKRNNNRRLLLILLISAYFFGVAPTEVENGYWYHYTAAKLGVIDADYVFYLTITSGLALIGTFIGTAILSKALGLSDSLIGIISAVSIIVSYFLNAFAWNRSIYYIAAVIGLFEAVIMIAIKSIGSSLIDDDEISKFMAILEISNPISRFIYPYLFTEVRKKFQIDSVNVGSLLIGVLYVSNVIVFIVCYVILRRNEVKNKKTKKTDNPLELVQDSGSDTYTHFTTSSFELSSVSCSSRTHLNSIRFTTSTPSLTKKSSAKSAVY